MEATTTHAPNGDNGEGDLKTITEREFCHLTGISIGTALILRKKGKLAHCRVGRRVLYIYPKHVKEFLAQNERPIAA